MINIHESVIKIKNKDKLFFGNLPFSDTFGLPFLVNRVLTSLLSYSNGIQRIAKEPATKISRVNREHFEFSSKLSLFMLVILPTNLNILTKILCMPIISLPSCSNPCTPMIILIIVTRRSTLIRIVEKQTRIKTIHIFNMLSMQ